jgi:hypothetical protein
MLTSGLRPVTQRVFYKTTPAEVETLAIIQNILIAGVLDYEETEKDTRLLDLFSVLNDANIKTRYT